MKTIFYNPTNTLPPPTNITIRTTNTYNVGDVLNISFGNNDTTRAVVVEAYNGLEFTAVWYDEAQNLFPTKQRKRKHKGQKYKPTTLDRLNQSKQSKFK